MISKLFFLILCFSLSLSFRCYENCHNKDLVSCKKVRELYTNQYYTPHILSMIYNCNDKDIKYTSNTIYQATYRVSVINYKKTCSIEYRFNRYNEEELLALLKSFSKRVNFKLSYIIKGLNSTITDNITFDNCPTMLDKMFNTEYYKNYLKWFLS